MAGATVHGKEGNVKWSGGVIEKIQSWECSVVGDVADVTGLQETWQTFKAGFTDWTATVTALLPVGGSDIDYSETDVATLELYLVFQTTDYKAVYGSAQCTGVAKAVPSDGPATVTYTFQGSGQLIWYSDTTVIS